MLTLRPTWEWDVAAGTLIAQRAGAYVSDRTGGVPRFNNPSGLLNGLCYARRPRFKRHCWGNWQTDRGGFP